MAVAARGVTRLERPAGAAPGGEAIPEGAPWAQGSGVGIGVLRDAWLFFLLLLLLTVVVFVLKPVQLLDRLLGTRLTDRLVSLIEMVAEL